MFTAMCADHQVLGCEECRIPVVRGVEATGPPIDMGFWSLPAEVIADVEQEAGARHAAVSVNVPTSHVDLAHYSAALDEIYRLRVALALEAETTAEFLTYSTLPRTVRKLARQQFERMRRAARGEAADAYADVVSQRSQELLEAVGASATLTRGRWEAR